MGELDPAEVREAVRDSGLFARDRPLVAMLSGGRDSTCLLDVVVTLLGAPTVVALHVNYGLRERADADKERCEALCDELGVELRVVRAAPGSAPGRPLPRAAGRVEEADDEPGRLADGELGRPASDEPGRSADEPGRPAGGESSEAVAGDTRAGNLQAWARDLRYAEAERLAAERDALIATGHTSSDQVETILYRLAASPGRRALLGMPAAEGRLIRPLLALTREQTAAYCRARGLGFVEDASNDDERFARTRVRNGLLPALRAVHPAAERSVLRTAALLREETELLDGLIAAELSDGSHVAVARLREMPAALARMVVVRLAEQAAGTYVPQAGERVGELLELARRGGRAELHVGGRAGAVIEDGTLRMVRLAPRESPPPRED